MSKASRWGGGVTADEMREMQWVRPELVAHRFVEWTAEGRLRHAAFLGLRTDKSAREVRREANNDVAILLKNSIRRLNRKICGRCANSQRKAAGRILHIRLTRVWLRLIATIEPIVGVIGQSTKIGRQRKTEFFNRIGQKRPAKYVRSDEPDRTLPATGE